MKIGYWALVDLMHGLGYDQPAIVGLQQIHARTTMKDLKAQIEAIQRFAAQSIQVRPNAILNQQIVPARWAKASMRSVMHLGAPMDHGNAMNRHKWIEDWLVTRGFLAADGPDALKWTHLPEQIIKRDGNYRCEITLTQLTP